jgi:hypothetical protein
MPIYQFSNPETDEVIDIVQKMKDEHVYIDDKGLEWERVWMIPNASIDTQVDPFDSKKYLDATRKKQNMGDMFDQARELSEKRAQQAGGEDPIKKKYLKEYSEKRGGKTHPDQNKDKTVELDLSKIVKKIS